MAHIEVKSRSIKSYSYDPVEQVMEATFLCHGCSGSGGKKEDPCSRCKGSGRTEVYRYADVPAEVYATVRDAESIGSAFNKHVVKGGFKWEKVAAA